MGDCCGNDSDCAVVVMMMIDWRIGNTQKEERCVVD